MIDWTVCRNVAFSLSALLLSACAGGGLLPENSALRGSLSIQTPTSPISISYKAVSECTYFHHVALQTGKSYDVQAILKMRPIKDRLQIISTKQGLKPNVALIGLNGHLYDFNDQGDYTPETRREHDDKFIRSQNPSTNPHVLDDWTFFTPEYIQPELRVGQIAAFVRDESSTVWGNFLFTGTTTYKGVQAAVLDLRRATSDTPVGFNVVDLRNGLPLLSVLDSGSHIRIEQTGCKS